MVQRPQGRKERLILEVYGEHVLDITQTPSSRLRMKATGVGLVVYLSNNDLVQIPWVMDGYYDIYYTPRCSLVEFWNHVA